MRLSILLMMTVIHFAAQAAFSQSMSPEGFRNVIRNCMNGYTSYRCLISPADRLNVKQNAWDRQIAGPYWALQQARLDRRDRDLSGFQALLESARAYANDQRLDSCARACLSACISANAIVYDEAAESQSLAQALRSGRGDCTDTTTIGVALLRGLGFEAWRNYGSSDGQAHEWVGFSMAGRRYQIDPLQYAGCEVFEQN